MMPTKCGEVEVGGEGDTQIHSRVTGDVEGVMQPARTSISMPVRWNALDSMHLWMNPDDRRGDILFYLPSLPFHHKEEAALLPRHGGGDKGGNLSRHPGLDPGSTFFAAPLIEKVDAGSSPA